MKALKSNWRSLIFPITLLFSGTMMFIPLCSCEKRNTPKKYVFEVTREIYQNRSPEQLLKLVALHQIQNLAPGEYKYGNWDSVLNSTLPKAPWFGYPMGVQLLGLQYANRILKDTIVSNYVRDYIKIATDDYAYSVWQRNTFGDVYKKGGNFDRLVRMSMLDDCGAAAASMLEALQNGIAYPTNELLRYLNNVSYFISKTHWRLDDSTFWRPVSPGSRPLSIWGDDLYMSCPFLIRWADFKGEPKYLDDAVRQVLNFSKYLQDKDGIFWHAYLVDKDHPAKFKWGRANGWVAVATAEVLSFMPDNHPKRDSVLIILKTHLEGLKKYQASDGLWHQVIDHPELTWGTETSCSAMFAYAFAKSINEKWIDRNNLYIVRNTIEGLNKRIDADGTIYGVCRSASIGDNLKYYQDRPTRPDDPHGPGPVLMALSEFLIAENPQLD